MARKKATKKADPKRRAKTAKRQATPRRLSRELQSTLRQLNRRASEAHKGDFGRVLIVGGSTGMVGAPALAANAALRAGAGLVKMAVPAPAQQAVATLAPCATSAALPADFEGRIAEAAIPALTELAQSHDVLAVGPGAGVSASWEKILGKLLALPGRPTVIDADGLNNLANMPQWRSHRGGDVVLTPHPGEMKRLLAGAGLPQQLDDRSAVARA
jgi:NAD(P)H-hydrate epimerase